MICLTFGIGKVVADIATVGPAQPVDGSIHPSEWWVGVVAIVGGLIFACLAPRFFRWLEVKEVEAMASRNWLFRVYRWSGFYDDRSKKLVRLRLIPSWANVLFIRFLGSASIIFGIVFLIDALVDLE